MRGHHPACVAACCVVVSACVPQRDCDLDQDGWESARCEGPDCNDSTSRVHPDALEVCDGMDNDCNGFVDGPDAANKPVWFRDADGDGYGDPGLPLASCTAMDGFVNNDMDCDDSRSLVRPGAAEVCDGRDDDCDGQIDEAGADLAPAWYPDDDEDGWGQEGAAPVLACAAPDGHVDNDLDCDDGEPEVHPGAEDGCDGRDSDCDGVVEFAWFRDFDGDGHGDPIFVMDACEPEAGFVEPGDDCDDEAADVHPGADEVCGDGRENDCDGRANECGLAGELFVPQDAAATILGDTADLHFGAALAAGDLDGDGAPDLVAAGPRLGSEEGGGTIGVFLDTLSSAGLASDADAFVDGGGSAWAFGAAIASGEDVDGDGLDDLLVGAPHACSGAEDVGAGMVLLFSGPLAGSLGPLDAAAMGQGAGAGVGYGSSVALVPDIDGDGLADIAVGAPLASAPGGGTGGVWVFRGKPGSFSLDPQDADAVIGHPPEEAQGLGWAVAGAGDADGDGMGDLAVGAPLHEAGKGGVFVFRGPLDGVVDTGSAWAVAAGGQDVASLGTSLDVLAGPGGQPLLLAGGVRPMPPDGWRATAWVLAAQEGVRTVEAALALAAGGAVLGPDPGGFPMTARSAGDLDGDGEDDAAMVWVGAAGASAAVWTSPWAGGLEDPQQPDATLSGIVPASGVRTPVAAAGDLDGDGYGDLVVGSWGSSAAASLGGAVHVLLGGPGL